MNTEVKENRFRLLSAGVLHTLSSVKFAVSVVVLVALACAAGTILPQGDTSAFVRKYPSMSAWIPLLTSLGLTNVFYSWWFVGLLGLLATTVAVCSSRRILAVKRFTGFARRRAIGSLLTHISILLVLSGGMVRGIWGLDGQIDLREGETKSEFALANRAAFLPFALRLKDFAVVRYGEEGATPAAAQEELHHLALEWPERGLKACLPVQLNVQQTLLPHGEAASETNTFQFRVLRYVPDFAMNSATREITSRSNEPENPAILVEVKGPEYQNNCWLFAKFPDFKMFSEGHQPNRPSPLRMVYEFQRAQNIEASSGPIRTFKSTLDVIENGLPAATHSIEVNRPLKYKGFTLYQTGYNPDDLAWTSLQVVRDPGVPLVYTGFCFLIAGLFTVFYLNPWIESRKQTP